MTTSSAEPVAGPSGITAETAIDAPRKGDSKSGGETVMKGAVPAGRMGAKKVSNSTSKAQINVVKTMVYITVCFTLCWMPMYIAVMFTRLVSQFKCLLTLS